MKLAVAATLAAALLAPSVAQGATLTVDPAQRCYRETQTIQLPGAGFTANAQVDFTRDGVAVPANPPIVADAVGNIAPLLTLPGLLSGQRNLTYTATDSANTANIATLGLLVTATDVDIKPLQGRPNRRLTITGRGFFGGGKRLWAHIKRGRRRGAQRPAREDQGRLQEDALAQAPVRGRRRARRLPRPVRRLPALPPQPRGQVALQRHDLRDRGGGGGGLGLASARLRLSRPRPRAARTGPRRHGGAP